MQNKIDGIVLFSGGLDSVLTAKLLQNLGLRILCAHFTSPFFGNASKVNHWQSVHGLDIEVYDISDTFCRMLAGWPPHNVGKTLNPCIDCKITLLCAAKELMKQTGARFIASGEVLGQRPMSQRMESFNIITKASETGDILLRPLCAQLLAPTYAELSGLVPREKLLRISGRGRNEQLVLAKELDIQEIPNPAGGCLLTERETARRYWPLLEQLLKLQSTSHGLVAAPDNHAKQPDMSTLVDDFRICCLGRMLWRQNTDSWLLIGRNKADNDKIMQGALPDDIVLRLPVPGPLALARHGTSWQAEILREAAAVLASYAPKNKCTQGELQIRVCNGNVIERMNVFPKRHTDLWNLPTWEEVHEQVKYIRKIKETERLESRRSHAIISSRRKQS